MCLPQLPVFTKGQSRPWCGLLWKHHALSGLHKTSLCRFWRLDVRDQDSHRLGVWRGPASWLVHSYLLVCSHGLFSRARWGAGVGGSQTEPESLFLFL